MSSSALRAEDLAERFSAAGYAPRTIHHGHHTCVEVDVAMPLSPECWQALLAVLEAADHFGLINSSTNGLTVWAAVH